MKDIPNGLAMDISSLRSKDGYLYAGIPNFLGLFGRDSAISAWQLLDYDIDIAKFTLKALAGMQGRALNESNGEEPGKILHEYYPNYTDRSWFLEHKGKVKWLEIGTPVYFSVDSTPLFLILYCEYLRRSKDAGFARALAPNAKAAAKWITDYGIVKFLLRYTKARSTDAGLLSQSWKDGFGNALEGLKSPAAIIEVQGYAYLALKMFSEAMKSVDPGYDTTIFTKAAQNIKQRMSKFWVIEGDYYALGLDGDGKQINKVTSNPGQLLLSGILEKNEADNVVRRLFQPDLITPYGLRTHSMLEKDYDQYSYQRGSVWPHDNWMIAQGLLRMGYKMEYELIKESLLKAYNELGCAPEFYGVNNDGSLIKIARMNPMPCIPQAWTAGAFVNLFMA